MSPNTCEGQGENGGGTSPVGEPSVFEPADGISNRSRTAPKGLGIQEFAWSKGQTSVKWRLSLATVVSDLCIREIPAKTLHPAIEG